MIKVPGWQAVIGFFEKYFAKEFIKRQVRDRHLHELFAEIVKEATEQYHEDNDTTVFNWLMLRLDAAAAEELPHINPALRYRDRETSEIAGILEMAEADEGMKDLLNQIKMYYNLRKNHGNAPTDNN
ncbi:MAG TPA: hypothetical protein VFM18_17990 [Methanosarcina sp.]|nr:hypothetical protein [Methanosarcina sp.]